jgi:hypothetical protein
MSPISSRNSVPPSACSKRPAAHGLRAGEGAALVAEQLGLQQILRDGRGVDGDKWPAAGARGMLVQRARHQFLAGAGFAGDQHRDVALRQAADGAEHVLHRRRLPVAGLSRGPSG